MHQAVRPGRGVQDALGDRSEHSVRRTRSSRCAATREVDSRRARAIPPASPRPRRAPDPPRLARPRRSAVRSPRREPARVTRLSATPPTHRRGERRGILGDRLIESEAWRQLNEEAGAAGCLDRPLSSRNVSSRPRIAQPKPVSDRLRHLEREAKSRASRSPIARRPTGGAAGGTTC